MTRIGAPILALLLLGPPVAAQDAAPDTACGYDLCALRLDAGVFGGRRLVRGLHGERVASLSPFSRGLSAAVAASDSAHAYARLFESRNTTGSAIGLVGAAVALVGFFMAADGFDIFGNSNDDRFETGEALMLGGAIVGAIGGIVVSTGERPLHKSIWWYNRDLAR